jgi:hypothetical protein
MPLSFVRRGAAQHAGGRIALLEGDTLRSASRYFCSRALALGALAQGMVDAADRRFEGLLRGPLALAVETWERGEGTERACARRAAVKWRSEFPVQFT